MPTILIQRFGLKKTISFSILGYLLLGVFSFIPRYYTLVPCGFITGLSAATLWTAHGMYTTQIAIELAEIEEQNLKLIFQKHTILCEKTLVKFELDYQLRIRCK